MIRAVSREIRVSNYMSSRVLLFSLFEVQGVFGAPREDCLKPRERQLLRRILVPVENDKKNMDSNVGDAVPGGRTGQQLRKVSDEVVVDNDAVVKKVTGLERPASQVLLSDVRGALPGGWHKT